MPDATDFETVIHGRRWLAFHGGFFSDAEVARPLVDEICRRADEARPDVLADLGGGTGYLLLQVKARRAGLDVINLDACPIQLAEAARRGVRTVQRSVMDFRRAELVSGDRRLMLAMRSVLHYLGESALFPALRHIRHESRPGEAFVHQTASFETPREAECFNALYRLMGTHKWYPTVEHMRRCSQEAGWRVKEVIPAASLRLTAHDLALRYRLDAPLLCRIREEIGREYADARDVFHPTREAFIAHLKYEIYVCEAA